MKVLERTIQLYRKVDNNEPMEEMHKRVMEGLSKIEAPLGLKDSEIPKTPDFGTELICFYYAKNIKKPNTKKRPTAMPPKVSWPDVWLDIKSPGASPPRVTT